MANDLVHPSTVLGGSFAARFPKAPEELAQRMKAKEGHDFFLGGNVKIVRRVIGSFANSWGFGIDLGLQYHVGKLRLAAVGRDLTTTFNAWKVTFTEKEKEVLIATGNELPDINSVEYTKPQVLLGAAYPIVFKKFTLTPELNFTATTDGKRNTVLSADPVSIDPNLGAELNYNNFLFLRAGISQSPFRDRYARDPESGAVLWRVHWPGRRRHRPR